MVVELSRTQQTQRVLNSTTWLLVILIWSCERQPFQKCPIGVYEIGDLAIACHRHGNVAPRFRMIFHSALDHHQDMNLRSTEFSPSRRRSPSTGIATRSQRLTSLSSHNSQRSKIPTVWLSLDPLYHYPPILPDQKD